MMEKYLEIGKVKIEVLNSIEMLNVRGGDGDGGGVLVLPPPPPPPPYPGG